MQALKLDRQLKTLVKTERKITYEILLLIQTIDITKAYRELGYESLYAYLTKEVGYSEGAAQRRISSARLMKQVPKIENEIQTGDLNLTQVSLAYTAIRQEEKALGAKISSANKSAILERLKCKNTFETQKVLQQELPSFEIPKPKAQPAGNDRVFVTLEFHESEWRKVQSMMAEFSHKVPDQRLESLLLYFADQMEKKKQKLSMKDQTKQDQTKQDQTKHDQTKYDQAKWAQTKIDQTIPLSLKQNQFRPVQGESKSQNSAKKSPSSPPLRRWNPKFNRFERQAISAPVRRWVYNQAQHRCQYVSPLTGKRCDSKHFLEIEHCVPVAKGGSNNVQNLKILCRAHNLQAAKREGVSRDR